MSRRFIAGAVCPGCQALDRLVVQTAEDGLRTRNCVACGYEDQTPGSMENVPAGVPRGRPEQNTKMDNIASPVKILSGKSD